MRGSTGDTPLETPKTTFVSKPKIYKIISDGVVTIVPSLDTTYFIDPEAIIIEEEISTLEDLALELKEKAKIKK